MLSCPRIMVMVLRILSDKACQKACSFSSEWHTYTFLDVDFVEKSVKIS